MKSTKEFYCHLQYYPLHPIKDFFPLYKTTQVFFRKIFRLFPFEFILLRGLSHVDRKHEQLFKLYTLFQIG